MTESWAVVPPLSRPLRRVCYATRAAVLWPATRPVEKAVGISGRESREQAGAIALQGGRNGTDEEDDEVVVPQCREPSWAQRGAVPCPGLRGRREFTMARRHYSVEPGPARFGLVRPAVFLR